MMGPCLLRTAAILNWAKSTDRGSGKRDLPCWSAKVNVEA